MAKSAVFGHWFAGPFMRAMRHIPVDRWTGASAYRQARRALDAGEVIGVFPEATISRSFLVKRLKPGAAGLAISRSAPLSPVAVWGSHRIATVDGRRSLRRGKAVMILLGEPLQPIESETIPGLTERLHTAMTSLLDEAIDTYPDVPHDDADRWWLPHDRGGTAPPPEVAAALDRLRAVLLPLVVYVVAAVGLLAWAWSGLDPAIRPLVPFYVLLLIGTAITSLALDRRAGIGGLMFLVSDAFIALGEADRMDKDAAWHGLVVMALYIGSIFLLSAGILNREAATRRAAQDGFDPTVRTDCWPRLPA
jgi:hypothetical protein